MPMQSSPRLCAASVLCAVTEEGLNLEDALARHLDSASLESHSYIKALCFGSVRFYPRLLFFLSHLLDKPLKDNQKLLRCLFFVCLYELYYMHTPVHATVNEAVNAVAELNKPWAKALMNAVLRKAEREREKLAALAEQSEGARTAHPKWLLKLFNKQWPEQAEQIIQANNTPGPLTLRVNRLKGSREDYLQRLTQHGIDAMPCTYSAQGIQCKTSVDVSELPGFAAGEVSVQDQAAQLAAGLLAPQPGERILDACAAPGGKTGHLLELCPDIELTAVDRAESRLHKVNDNLGRLGLQANVKQGDACEPGPWWDGVAYDRILIDAPCSATGVIRRHPDIKLLRKVSDLEPLAQIQSQILTSLWPLLKSEGMLLYATCSVLQQENDHQIQQFMQAHRDATTLALDVQWGHATAYGRQILPGESAMDGFFYAAIKKA